MLVVFLAIVVFTKNSDKMSQTFKPDWKHAVFIVILAVYTLLGMNHVTEFLYFNF